MDRRSFLRIFGITAAVAAVDPEALIWTPGQKTIFDLGSRPPDIVPVTLDQQFGVDMAWDEDEYEYNGNNVIVTPHWIAMEALKILQNRHETMIRVNRDYDQAFPILPGDGFKYGSVINVRKPKRFSS